MLPGRPRGRGKWIFAALLIAIIHVLLACNNFSGTQGLPNVQFRQKGVGRRTARATLRREEFNNHRSRLPG